MALGPLDHVYYWTSDMDRSVRFYREVVGLRLVRREDSHWAEFDTGSVHLALHGTVEGKPVEAGGAAAVFRVEDLDAARTALEARGVTFEEHAGEVEGLLRFATFRDPDGNRVDIVEYAGGHR